jgi:hypothetical protein
MITFDFIKVRNIFRKLVAIDFLEITRTMELGSYLLSSCDFACLVVFYVHIGLLLTYLLTNCLYRPVRTLAYFILDSHFILSILNLSLDFLTRSTPDLKDQEATFRLSPTLRHV